MSPGQLGFELGLSGAHLLKLEKNVDGIHFLMCGQLASSVETTVWLEDQVTCPNCKAELANRGHAHRGGKR